MKPTKLTLKVDPKLKKDFKSLCKQENTSISKAIRHLMRISVDKNNLSFHGGYSTDLAAAHFANREIETLKILAANYSEISDNYNSLKKQVLQLEELL